MPHLHISGSEGDLAAEILELPTWWDMCGTRERVSVEKRGVLLGSYVVQLL